MSALACPEEEVLMSMVFGEPSSAEVQSHVQTCDSCRQRVQQMRHEVETLRQFHEAWPATTPAPTGERPAMIGKYFIAGLLGQGGEAAVYRALHPTLGKDVAIKWSKKRLEGDARGHEQMIAEGKVLASLEHANLVRVFDLDFHEDRPFLVMEFVRGGNLEELALLDPPLTPARAAGLVAPLARAVALAHQHGITHQDIKPRNVLIHEDGRPLLSDFGLARLRANPEGGPVGGTPGFMAPEQARGEAAAIGPRSDIFALGGVLFFLLTRKPPVSGNEAFQVLQATARGEIDLQPLEEARVPRALAAICRRALSTRPEERYATGDAMAQDLERFVRLPQRRRFLLAAGVAAATLAGAWFAWPRSFDLPQGPRTLLTSISRGRRTLQLAGAMPLRSGDTFQVECPVPRHTQVGLFGLDAGGQFTTYTNVELVPAGPFDTLRYPKEGKKAQLPAGSGTELLLVVAGRAAPSPDDVETLLKGDGPWPEMPDHSALLMNPDLTEWAEDARPLLEVPGDPATLTKARMEKLRLALKEAGYVDFAAVAFPHRERD